MKKTLASPAAPAVLPPPAAKPLAFRARIAGALTLLGLVAGLGLLASRPAHTIGGPVAVAVSNVPLPTTAADSPAKQPFQQTLEFRSNGGNTAFTTVPAGKRLVIESVTAFTNIVNDSHSHSISLIPNVNTDGFQELDLLPTSSPYHAVTQNVLLYTDAGNAPAVFVQTSGNTTPDIFVTLSGYYVNVP